MATVARFPDRFKHDGIIQFAALVWLVPPGISCYMDVRHVQNVPRQAAYYVAFRYLLVVHVEQQLYAGAVHLADYLKPLLRAGQVVAFVVHQGVERLYRQDYARVLRYGRAFSQTLHYAPVLFRAGHVF